LGSGLGACWPGPPREVTAEPLDSTYEVSLYVPPELDESPSAPWLLVLDGRVGWTEASVAHEGWGVHIDGQWSPLLPSREYGWYYNRVLGAGVSWQPGTKPVPDQVAEGAR